MKALSNRILIATDHRNECQDSKIKEVFTSIKTPEHTGEQFQEAYDNNKEIKKILKDDFKKRYIKYKNIQKNKTNSSNKTIAVLGLITLIYILTFIIMRTALGSTNNSKTNDKAPGYKPSTTNDKFRSIQQIKEHNELVKKNKPKWPTKEKENELQNKKPTVIHLVCQIKLNL